MISTLKPAIRHCRRLLIVCALFATPLAHAQTYIFVENNTAHELLVNEQAVSGDPVSKKAWQAGQQKIAAGERVKVLTLNRAGKVNWMDPTPRYIEPGKTALFSTSIVTAGHSASMPAVLKQTLTGTGASSKMQHSLDGVAEPQPWSLDKRLRQVKWPFAQDMAVSVSYRAYAQSGKTHVEYVFSE